MSLQYCSVPVVAEPVSYPRLSWRNGGTATCTRRVRRAYGTKFRVRYASRPLPSVLIRSSMSYHERLSRDVYEAETSGKLTYLTPMPSGTSLNLAFPFSAKRDRRSRGFVPSISSSTE